MNVEPKFYIEMGKKNLKTKIVIVYNIKVFYFLTKVSGPFQGGG